MFIEKRKVPRVKSHIIVEMNLPGQFSRFCGYIENLSENGLGVISMDSFPVGTKIAISFIIPDSVERVTTNAVIIRNGSGVGLLNYQAFTFEDLSDANHQRISRYIREHAA